VQKSIRINSDARRCYKKALRLYNTVCNCTVDDIPPISRSCTCTDSAISVSRTDSSDAVWPVTSRPTMTSVTSATRLLMLMLATLAYPRGVASEVSDAGLAGAVVGTFVGTLLLCGLLAALGYWCCVRKRRQDDDLHKQQRQDVEAANTLPSE